MSRLKREGNPPSNQLASPVPQAWDPSINDFREITGQNLGGGRFGADGVQWGKTASGLFVPVRVTNDGVQEVQVSGTITELVLEQIGATYMIGQTLRFIAEGGDTITSGKAIDASKHKEWFIHIQNSHEKEITLQLNIRSHGGQIINNTTSLGFYPDTPISIPAGASKVLTKDDIPQLGWAIPAFIFYCRSQSPTQGSMDVRIYGRRW